MADLKTVIRFKDVVDANFALDLKAEMNKKMARRIEARRR